MALALFNFILAPFALITGFIALFQVWKNNEYNGDAKYAIFGTVAGGIQILGFTCSPSLDYVPVLTFNQDIHPPSILSLCGNGYFLTPLISSDRLGLWTEVFNPG